jgi:HEAT repeat protein
MWIFGKKKATPEQSDRSRLLELAERWRSFGAEELDQPHLERKLKTLCDELDRDTEAFKTVLQQAGEKGGVEDVDFLFQVLFVLPEPPTAYRRAEGTADERRRPQTTEGKEPRQVTSDTGRGSLATSSKQQAASSLGLELEAWASLIKTPEFSWERADKELGAIVKVATAIRVSIQQRIRQSWQKNLSSLEKRVTALSANARDKEKLDEARADLENNRQAERNELNRIDQDFRSYLVSLLHMHELHDAGFKALTGVKTDDGEQEIVATLRTDVQGYRALAVKSLKRRGFVPTTTDEKLDFYVVLAKVPETETEGAKKLAELVHGTTNVSELLEIVEPRFAEEGLTELQALLLEHLCTLHSDKALDRLAQVLASSLEPPSLKMKVAQALPDFGTPKAVELLIKAMDELDMEVRAAAADALGQVGARAHDAGTATPSQSSGTGVLPDSTRAAVVERLVFALRDGDILVRETAAKALKHYPEARIKLIATLGQDRNPNAREYAARALENLAPEPGSTAALVQAMKDEDSAVRRAAGDALVKQGQVPEDPELKIRYLCARQNWKELRKIGRPATACLVSLIRDRNEEIRLAVVETLGAIRAGDSVKELCVSLSDSNQEVREQAAVGLRLINDASALAALRTALLKEGFKEVKAEIQAAIAKLETKR